MIAKALRTNQRKPVPLQTFTGRGMPPHSTVSRRPPPPAWLHERRPTFWRPRRLDLPVSPINHDTTSLAAPAAEFAALQILPIRALTAGF